MGAPGTLLPKDRSRAEDAPRGTGLNDGLRGGRPSKHQRAGVGAGRAARTESDPSLAGVGLAAVVGASLMVVPAAAMPAPQQLGVDTTMLRLTTV